MNLIMSLWRKPAVMLLNRVLATTLLIPCVLSGNAFTGTSSEGGWPPENGGREVLVLPSDVIGQGDNLSVNGDFCNDDSLLAYNGGDNVIPPVLIFNAVAAVPMQLWGMTAEGGAYNGGVIFKTDSSGQPQVMHSFGQGFTLGQTPYGSLLQAGNGKLYGMTTEGGTAFWGTLFEYDPVQDTHIVRVNFGNYGSGGDAPSGTMIEAANGKLYGMTPGEPQGMLFEFDPATNIFLVKKKFDFNSVGASPYGSLLEASNGKMYGMTIAGGSNFVGTIFEYDYNTNSLIKKRDLDSAGNTPEGSFIEASSGGLYGMTRWGGTSNMGVLFRYDPASNSFTPKHDFDGATGSSPSGDVVEASNAKLYGMTPSGGANAKGVLFEYDPVADTLVVKHHFDGANTGAIPRGSLMKAYDGRLYGMTSEGGASNQGVLFAYDPVADSVIVLFQFNGTNGAGPYYSWLIEVDPCLPLPSSSSIDSICAGDSVFAAGSWRSQPGTYYDTLVAASGCDSLIIAVIEIDTATACGLQDSLTCVSDGSWWQSTVVTASDKQGFWGGVTSLPAVPTFSLLATVGQPYPWGGLKLVAGSQPISSLENIRYFRKTFSLSNSGSYNARIQMYMDDGTEIYLNGHLLAREEDMDSENRKGLPHDLVIANNHSVSNGYNGNDIFDMVPASLDLDTVLQAGSNEIVVVLRNPAGGHNIGGFSFRMDLNRKQIPDIPNKSAHQSAVDEVVIYPNPFFDYVQVLLPEEIGAGAVVSVYDVRGRLVLEKELGSDTVMVVLNLGSLQAGVYQLKLDEVNRTFGRILLIKQ